MAHPDASTRSRWRVVPLAAGALLIAVSILTGVGNRSTSLLIPGSPGYRGLVLWRNHNCAACHAVFGLGGHIGPDLTNVTGRRNEAYLRHVLRYGMSGMPGLDLNADAASDLIAYLRHVDGLGTYPLDSPDAPGFGISR